MTQQMQRNSLSARKLLPLAVILVAAVAGFVLLRDDLSFESLRDNREILLALDKRATMNHPSLDIDPMYWLEQ